MCNEKTKEKDNHYDYRFIDYRLTQLENNLRKGQEKLEQDQKTNYQELIKMLQTMQESSNNLSQKIIELKERQYALEEKSKRVDQMKETIATHEEKISDHDRRLGIYQTVLIGVTITVVAAVVIFILKIFQ
jgi:uncharacterized protein (DUF3084 family)